MKCAEGRSQANTMEGRQSIPRLMRRHKLKPTTILLPALSLLLLSCCGASSGVSAEVLVHSENENVPLSSQVLPEIVYSVSIPREVSSAYIIQKIPLHADQSIKELLPTTNSDYFAVLEDGIVMTVGRVSPLVGSTVELRVLTEYINGATRVYVINVAIKERSSMLRFLQPTYEANVYENLPAGTELQGLEELEAVGGTGEIRYKLHGKTAKYLAVHRSISGLPSITLLQPLDAEAQKQHKLIIQASDTESNDIAKAEIVVNVLDVNDHAPIFNQNVFYFFVPMNMSRFDKIGTVSAHDGDGDEVLYRLVYPSNTFTIVPQTGQIMLIGPPEATVYELELEAFDKRKPTQYSDVLAKAHIEFRYPTDTLLNLEAIEDESHNNWLLEDQYPERELDGHSDNPTLLSRKKRSQVRHTKEITFSEAGGAIEGKVVFQLEKEIQWETFKIRDDNPWVEVDPNGAVRVKQKWDYEELGPEKTIDFWVKITNNDRNGEYLRRATAAQENYLPSIKQLMSLLNLINLFSFQQLLLSRFVNLWHIYERMLAICEVIGALEVHLSCTLISESPRSCVLSYSVRLV